MMEGLNNPSQDWLEQQLQQQVAIWCEDPEVNTERIGGMLTIEKTYLTYRILYKQMGRDLIAVRHRYSEFEGLRNALRDRYHPMGILVPSLPPKNSVSALSNKISSKVDDTFVKERTLGLTLFCENIVSSPFLRNDPQWKSFTRPSGGGIVADDSSVANSAEAQLVGCLKQLDIPYKYTMTQRIEDIKEEVQMIEGHAKFLLDKARAVQTAERNLQAANEHLKRGLEGWFDAERIHIKSLGGRIFDEHEPVIKQHESITQSVIAYNGVVSAKRNAEHEVPNYIGLTLIALLEFELANVESFKELFKVHEEMLKEIDSIAAKINKLENSKKGHEQIPDLRRQLEDKQMCLQVFYKGFIYFTIPTLARVRASYARKFFSGTICSTMTNSFTVFKACQEFFHQLQLPNEQVADDTSRMLELLGVKPIAKLPYDEINSIFLGDSRNEESSSPVSPNVSGLTISGKSGLKSSNLFMSYESNGITGLFERGLALSKKKPAEKSSTSSSSSGASTGVATTHLFTSSINPHATHFSGSNPLASPSQAAATNTPPPAPAATGGNPLGDQAPSAPLSPTPNPLARRGSAVMRKQSSESMLPRFVEDGGASAAAASEETETAPMAVVTPTKPVGGELNEKSKNLLSSLLGGDDSSSNRSQSNKLSLEKKGNIWDEA